MFNMKTSLQNTSYLQVLYVYEQIYVTIRVIWVISLKSNLPTIAFLDVLNSPLDPLGGIQVVVPPFGSLNFSGEIPSEGKPMISQALISGLGVRLEGVRLTSQFPWRGKTLTVGETP